MTTYRAKKRDKEELSTRSLSNSFLEEYVKTELRQEMPRRSSAIGYRKLALLH